MNREPAARPPTTPGPTTDPSRAVEHRASDRTPDTPATAEGSSAAVHAPAHVSLSGPFPVVAGYSVTAEIARGGAGCVFAGHDPGGLFAFTEATDPDAALLIEARKVKGGAWQFAFARLNGSCGLRAAHKDVEVWKVERLPWKTVSDRKQPYFGYTGLWK